MFRSLNVDALGVTGRQSEIIELALTYGFRGLDLNMDRFLKRVENQGLDRARRYLDSAKLKIGSFELPIRWMADDAEYKKELERLRQVAETVKSLGGKRCHATVRPISEDRPYHENFELHRTRLAEIGDLLAEYGLRFGLGLQASPERRKDGQFQFIYQAEPLLLLIKGSGNNVGLALDTWNWHFGGGAMDQLRDLGVNNIVSVRLADAPPDKNAENITEEQRLLPEEGGVVDNIGVLKWLSQNHYDGPISPGPHPRRFTGMTRDNIVHRAAQAMDACYRAAGLMKITRAEQPVAVAADVEEEVEGDEDE